MYLPERDLVVYLLQKEYFNAYFSYLSLEHIRDNYKELHYLYTALRDMHKEYPAKDFDLNALQAYFFYKYPDADKELYLELFKTLSETQLDPEVGVGLLKAIKRRQQALNLSEAAMQFATGHADMSKVVELAKELETEVPEETDGPALLDLEDILETAILKPGIRWRLNCLNKSLGSLREGDFGFLFKRPESGGTAFAADTVGHAIPQVERPIVWLNNEEADNKVILRIYQSYFGVTLEQLIANKRKYSERFKAEVGRKFQFYGLEYCNKQAIEAIIKREKPRLVIYDQLDKVLGFDNDRDDLRLGAIYQWARELCKQGHSAIGITQADGSAENTKWLDMRHVANAKTSKQAEGDWILGMGKIHDQGAEYVRYLSICKNKLLGDQDSIPDLRHGRFEVIIEPQIMRFKDVVKYD
jgi:hypothetical protein